ncbi:MAG: small multi-drug export protein [Methanomicrobiaceae archaeon]|nr:small multi-drug export protein [Methanomicrobiaceae archaeon]
MTDLHAPEIPEIKDPFLKRAFFIIFPFIVIGTYILILFLSLAPEDFEIVLGLMAVYFVPPAGKESVIPLGIALGIPWYVIATTAAMMDVAAALFMILNFDLVLKIPVLGNWVHTIMDKGSSFFIKYKWLERLSIFGLMLFIMVPFQGSGGIGGSIVGRMMGLPKLHLFLGITAGAFIGSYLIAVGFEFATGFLHINPLYLALTILAVVIIASAANFLYKRIDSRKGG